MTEKKRKHDPTISIDLTRGDPKGEGSATLHFHTGLLTGLRLIGFTIHKSRGGALSVQFPSRAYRVNGELRTYALLRPEVKDANKDLIGAILLAYHDALEKEE